MKLLSTYIVTNIVIAVCMPKELGCPSSWYWCIENKKIGN